MILLKKIRKSPYSKSICFGLSLTLVIEGALPTILQALTSGTQQPEFTGYTGGIQEMVDPFTGDFKYSIPLLEIDGYPLNLNYDANVGMDQEASWVGLGWSLHPGSIQRNLRGFPDDFHPRNDKVTKVEYSKPNTTIAMSSGNIEDWNANASLMFPVASGVAVGGSGSFSAYNGAYGGDYKHSIIGNGYEHTSLSGNHWSVSLDVQLLECIRPSLSYSQAKGKYRYENDIIGNSYRNEKSKTIAASISVSAGIEGTLAAGGGVGAGVALTNSFSESSGSRTGFNGFSHKTDISVFAGAGIGVGAVGENKKGNKGFVGLASAGIDRSASIISLKNDKWQGYSAPVMPPTLKQNTTMENSYTYKQYTKTDISFKVGYKTKKWGATLGGGYRKDIVNTNSFTSIMPQTTQSEAGHTIHTTGACGYLNNNSVGNNVLRDHQREKERYFKEGVNKNLPVPILAHDIFSGNAMGASFGFRAHRYGSQITHEPSYTHNGSGTSYSEIDQDKKASESNGTNRNSRKSGEWLANNLATEKLAGIKDSDYPLAYKNGFTDTPVEEFYFKSTTETGIFNEQHFNKFGGIDFPSRPKIQILPGYKPRVATTGEIVTQSYSGQVIQAIPDETYIDERIVRNQVIIPRNNEQTKACSFFENIENWTPYNIASNDGQTSKSNIDRSIDQYKKNHINEIEILNTDGKRYIYSTPVYNHSKTDYIFSVAPSNIDLSSRLCEYSTSERSINNRSGRTNYYSENKIPGYATSFLLNAILSSDYKDLNSDGPTEDDPGNYIKFNHSKVHNEFKWRSPLAKPNSGSTYNVAAYIEGLQSDSKDDMAAFSYGTREVWYPHSIETKNMLVEFYLEDRYDGYGAVGIDGGINTTVRLKKLSRIEVYNLKDRKKNGAGARAIKKVFFEYDYSLCPQTPNSTGSGNGKLSLRKLYIVDGESYKGKTHPYEFYYNSKSSSNFSYHPLSVDRWGEYKPSTSSFDNEKYPYSIQNKNLADVYAAAWKLDSIVMPSGASMGLDYECDDYAYIQDKRPMRWFNIIGTGYSPNYQSGFNHLYDNPSPITFDPLVCNYLFIALDEPIQASNPTSAKEQLENRYLRDLTDKSKYLIVNAAIDFSGDIGTPFYEKVECHLSIDDYGVIAGGSGEYDKAWIKLDNAQAWLQKLIDNDDMRPIKTHLDKRPDEIPYGKLNPITHFGWQKARTSMHNYTFIDTHVPEDLIALDAGMLFKRAANKIKLSESFARLYDPNNTKFGGGHRVKEIRFHDGWGNMNTSQTGHTYGQLYKYETATADYLGSISSGVASFEPIQGINESPFYEVIWENFEYIDFKQISGASVWSDAEGVENYVLNFAYDTEPYAASFYPSPVVGYSRVEIQDLSYANVTQNTTGHTEKRFYTARDFPTKIRRTSVSNGPLVPFNPFKSGITKERKDYVYAASQGYLLENNNMHGALISSYDYNPWGDLVSGQKINYLTNSNPSDKPISLDHTIKTVKPNGTIATNKTGIEAEVYSDMTNYEEDASNKITQENWKKVAIVSKVVRGINKVFGTNIDDIRYDKQPDETQYNNTYEAFYSAVMVKKVDKKGLVGSIETLTPNTRKNQRTEAYDHLSLEPLVSSVNNEFDNRVFTFYYPAHWAYDEFKHASIAQNMRYNASISSNGVATCTVSQSEFLLQPGDEVLYYLPSGASYQYWVLETNKTQKQATLINAGGVYAATSSSGILEIVRPNANNRFKTSIGNIQCLSNPVSGSSLQFADVVHADAIEMDNSTRFKVTNTGYALGGTFDCCIDHGTGCADQQYGGVDPLYFPFFVNPVLYNLIGHIGLKTSYSYFSNRSNQYVSTPINLELDGRYFGFYPFWVYNSSVGRFVPSTNMSYWRPMQSVTKTHQNGVTLETKSILNQYTSTLLGYNSVQNQNIPVANASNAKYSQIAFESFEDWDYNDPQAGHGSGHFSFQGIVAPNQRINTAAHTGTFSLGVCAYSYQYIQKEIVNLDTVYSSNDKREVQGNQALGEFSPSPGRYLFSAWVSEREPVQSGSIPPTIDSLLMSGNYRNASVKIFCYDISGNLLNTDTIYTTGNIVEAWQKIEGDYTVVLGTKRIRVQLMNTGPNFILYDDLRMHPYNATMQTYVYDYKDLSLISVLDDNNYATLMEYDNARSRVRTKKETVKGVFTLNEQRSSIFKH